VTRPLVESLVASVVVTAATTAAAMFLPQTWVATAVGLVFLATTWLLVWRRDDATVRRSGLSLGGLVLPGQLDVREVAASAGRALLWAFAFFALIAVPYFFAWRWWWAPKLGFSLEVRPLDALNEVLGQVVVIALPEEAFYRGYLQSRLDEVWTLGHLATVHQPARLAVFFPALAFGWLRARTGGIGAGVAFHALCNIYSEALGRGFGVY
jgi:membrane protease YdiL (CAAX protease family)